MRIWFPRLAAGGATAVIAVVLTTPTAGAGTPTQPAWSGFAGNAQHTAQAPAAAQPLDRIHWHAPVDLHPAHEGTEGPFSHYGSPMITSRNTVVVPTRLGPRAGFALRAYTGTDGATRWRMRTDYAVPVGASRQSPPPLPAALLDDTRVAVAGAGGTLLIRSRVNGTSGHVRRCWATR